MKKKKYFQKPGLSNALSRVKGRLARHPMNGRDQRPEEVMKKKDGKAA